MRVSVTDQCNLRCRYCMPAGAAAAHGTTMDEDEIIRAIEAASELGINKIRITGGEPLVRKNILSICRRAAAMPGIREATLTTNGLLLSDMAGPLKDAGIRRVNISLDTLDPEKYAHITRGGSLGQALRGIEAARSAGLRVKINTVLIGGFNDGELSRLADMTRENDMDIRFIELMPMTGDFGQDAYLTFREARALIPGLVPLPGDGAARMFQFEGARGRVGFISPMTCNFCSQCNRIRLTADGYLKPCLHSRQEIPIKGLSREKMKEAIRRAILAKPERHPYLSASRLSEAGRSMNRIGG